MKTLPELEDVLLGLPEAVVERPFGPETLVYKVAGKMFAITAADPGDEPVRVTLKCDPGWAVALRERHDAVAPGYHTNKRHWNTVTLDGSIPHDELVDMVEHSYARVLDGLVRRDRERLQRAWDEARPEP